MGASILLFSEGSRDGTIEEIHEVLRKSLRKKRGREESPSIGVIDSQSVQVTKISGECRGVDGGKKIKGRKRHTVFDSVWVAAMNNMLKTLRNQQRKDGPCEYFFLRKTERRLDTKFNEGWG